MCRVRVKTGATRSFRFLATQVAQEKSKTANAATFFLYTTFRSYILYYYTTIYYTTIYYTTIYYTIILVYIILVYYLI